MLASHLIAEDRLGTQSGDDGRRQRPSNESGTPKSVTSGGENRGASEEKALDVARLPRGPLCKRMAEIHEIARVIQDGTLTASTNRPNCLGSKSGSGCGETDKFPRLRSPRRGRRSLPRPPCKLGNEDANGRLGKALHAECSGNRFRAIYDAFFLAGMH